jgi:hypothetical protein
MLKSTGTLGLLTVMSIPRVLLPTMFLPFFRKHLLGAGHSGQALDWLLQAMCGTRLGPQPKVKNHSRPPSHPRATPMCRVGALDSRQRGEQEA